MKCTLLPSIPLPTLPGGISLGAALPSQDFGAELCCKILVFNVSTPPINLGVTLDPASLAALRTIINGVQDYIDQLPLRCPRE